MIFRCSVVHLQVAEILVLLVIHLATLTCTICNPAYFEALTGTQKVMPHIRTLLDQSLSIFLLLNLAYDSCVRGVTTDSLNSQTITCSQNGELVFWQFKNKHFSLKNLNITKFYGKIDFNESVNQILLHRESAMLAVALDDFSIVVVDCDIRKIVRKFSGHFNKISDMAFSNDARWLLTASMDCMIKVWDLPSSK